MKHRANDVPVPHFIRACVFSLALLGGAVIVLLSGPPLGWTLLAGLVVLMGLLLLGGFAYAEWKWRHGVDIRVLPKA